MPSLKSLFYLICMFAAWHVLSELEQSLRNPEVANNSTAVFSTAVRGLVPAADSTSVSPDTTLTTLPIAD